MSAQFPRVRDGAVASLPRAAQMRVLVTGASGFVGSLLIPRLLLEGHAVRALGRDSARVEQALAGALAGPDSKVKEAGLEVLEGDLLRNEGLAQALKDVEVAYYLIHSMERYSGGSMPFAEREQVAAENFTRAATRAGVRRIVYLGGLVPRWEPAGGTAAGSRHLASREAVERILLAGVPDSVALRASIVIGARSRSFRFLVRLVERLPVLALPPWHRFRTQPIDARDVAEMLVACATAPLTGRSLELGGPEVLSYGEMIAGIAELMLVNRASLRLGVSATPIAGRVAAAITNEDPELVLPLMEGLQGDLLAAEDGAAGLLGVELHSFASAVEHALGEWEQFEPLRAR
jgi:uncharacterized protein YbjT (DUF2867 family)